MARHKRNSTVEEVNADVAASIDFDNISDVEPINDDGIITNIQPEEEKQEELVKEKEPKINDPDWTSWVLGQFEQNELDEGLPKVNGLRRMARKLIGPIIKSKSDTKQCPTIENEQRATVEYTIVILNKYLLEDDEEPHIIEFTDVADAYKGNIKGLEYARFPTANASTRAEVRVLRKLLNLSVVASEEISDQPLEEAGFSNRITESQITKIDIKCHQLNIDVMKFINMGKTKYNKIEDIPQITAVKMFGLINEYQQEVKPIPESIKGYSPSWRGE
jgi:hypothetical protein